MSFPTIKYAKTLTATNFSPVTYKAAQGYPIQTDEHPAFAPQGVSKPVTAAKVITQSSSSAPVRLAAGQARVVTPAPAAVIRQEAPATSQACSDQTPWGGGCPWQCDKTEFKKWCKAAVDDPTGSERKELYGFLAECFLDADADRDGKIAPEEFDFLVEKAASLPRRFGLAPSWPEAYGDLAHRMEVRHQMFLTMNVDHSGLIGLSEWVEFAIAHITEKVRSMDDVLDFQHLEKRGQQEMVSYCEVAVTNMHSEHYKSLYEHLFKTFVESDVEENAAIRREQFDILIEDAAKAPRVLGLAPSASDTYASEAEKVAARNQMFKAMDTDGIGEVTFENFLAWSLEHIAGKVSAYKSGQGYQKRAVAAQAVAKPLNTYTGVYQQPAVSPKVISQPAASPKVISRPAASPLVLSRQPSLIMQASQVRGQTPMKVTKARVLS